jgi:hypothetical protein
LQQSRATLRQDCLENGEMAARPASWRSGYTIVFIAYASAATPAGSSTSAQGRQSIETNPGVCSIRRNQARIAGKVARS